MLHFAAGGTAVPLWSAGLVYGCAISLGYDVMYPSISFAVRVPGAL